VDIFSRYIINGHLGAAHVEDTVHEIASAAAGGAFLRRRRQLSAVAVVPKCKHAAIVWGGQNEGRNFDQKLGNDFFLKKRGARGKGVLRKNK
jgi:hypothetical protein